MSPSSAPPPPSSDLVVPSSQTAPSRVLFTLVKTSVVTPLATRSVESIAPSTVVVTMIATLTHDPVVTFSVSYASFPPSSPPLSIFSISTTSSHIANPTSGPIAGAKLGMGLGIALGVIAVAGAVYYLGARVWNYTTTVSNVDGDALPCENPPELDSYLVAVPKTSRVKDRNAGEEPQELPNTSVLADLQ